MRKADRLYRGMVLLNLLLVLAISGCVSNYEPDELAYVLLIGIDRGNENLLRVSYLIAIPKELAGGEGGGGGGGGGSAGKGSMVTSVESPSLYASMNMVNTYVGRKISLMHAKGIIFSEAMARDGTMAKFVPALTQFRESRGTAFVAVSREKPEEILETMKPLLESNPAKYIELLAGTQKFTGFIPNVQLQQFYNEIKVEGINPVCILVAKSDGKLPARTGRGKYRTEGSYEAGELNKKGGVAIEAMGAAAFRAGVMAGKLNGDETALYSMFRGKFGRGIFSFPDPLLREKTILSMDVIQARKPAIKVRLTDKGPVINARLSLEGNLLGVQSLIDYGMTQNRKILEKGFEKFIKREADALVKRTQQELKSDILGFGARARRLALTEKEWRELNWDSLYRKATVNVEVDYKLRRTGLLLRIMPVAEPDKGVHEGENPR